MKKMFLLTALAFGAMFVFSCSKSDLSAPAAVNSVSSTVQPSGAVARVNPAPGNYKVSLYVDDGDTTTATFKGYVFTFKTGGILLAAIGNTTYMGTWESKDGGTELKLNIDGTEALHDISKGWDVVKMTSTVIRLSDADAGMEGSRLVFKML